MSKLFINDLEIRDFLTENEVSAYRLVNTPEKSDFTLVLTLSDDNSELIELIEDQNIETVYYYLIDNDTKDIGEKFDEYKQKLLTYFDRTSSLISYYPEVSSKLDTIKNQALESLEALRVKSQKSNTDSVINTELKYIILFYMKEGKIFEVPLLNPDLLDDTEEKTDESFKGILLTIKNDIEATKREYQEKHSNDEKIRKQAYTTVREEYTLNGKILEYKTKVSRNNLARRISKEISEREGVDIYPSIIEGALQDAYDICIKQFEDKQGTLPL